jgi:hypothetical protein
MADETPLTITVPEAGKRYFACRVVRRMQQPNAVRFRPCGSVAFCGSQSKRWMTCSNPQRNLPPNSVASPWSAL